MPTPVFLRGLALCIVLASFTSYRVEAAQADLYEPVTSGRFAELATVPAYRIRGYVSGLTAQIAAQCTSLTQPAAAADYGPRVLEHMTPAERGAAADLAHAYAAAAIVAENNHFFEEISNPQRGASRWVKASRCSTAAYEQLTGVLQKLLSSPTLAGPIESEVQQTCTTLTTGRSECACFVNAVDMQSTPEQRIAFLDAKDRPRTLQQMLRDQYFQTGILVKCKRIPDFTYSLSALQLRDAESTQFGQVLRGWHNTSNTSYRDTDRVARLEDALMYADALWQRSRRAPRVLVCTYGPPTVADPRSATSANVRYFWQTSAPPPQADLRRELAGYPYLDKVLAMGDGGVTICPATLDAPAQESPRQAAAERLPSRSEPRKASASTERCPRLLDRLEQSRARARAGSYPLNALKRQEDFYAANCGAVP
jgi:hypothetical protein